MDQQTITLLMEHATLLFCAVAGALVICLAYRYAVDPADIVAWLPPVIILLAVTTALVISVIKSSIALSLGLIGALSVARFRAAIGDPRQLALVMVAITIGIGFGAGELLLTGLGTMILAGVIAIFYAPGFWEQPANTSLSRIVARLRYSGDVLVTPEPICDYLRGRHVSYHIRGTARKGIVTTITVHFHDCPVLKADQLVRELAGLFPDCSFESELAVKTTTAAEPVVVRKTGTSERGRATVPDMGAAVRPTLKPAR